ncbi:hypothetical protein K431DRAFT_189996, partial [Polychaeton citri CBS 116435]
MPIFNVYSYNSLPEKGAIRLVVLHPSTDETAPITCRIIEHRLSAQTVDYSAVSYAWGKQERTQNLEITCDGDVRYLRITSNVETILKCLRRQEKPQHLWIDTICFNQDDEVEKSHQIPIIGNIYKKAVAVDIWLGLENHSTARVLAFFGKVSRLPDVAKWKTQSQLAKRLVFLMRKTIHRDTSNALSAILDFFQQTWFSCRWVIQEACLAQQGAVHCGRQSIALQSLTKAAVLFQRLGMLDYAIKVAANLGHQTAGLSMLELLWHFHDSECLEPRDRIAAFFGLAQDGKDLRLNYTKSSGDVFEDFASSVYDRGCNDTRLQLLLHLFEFG